MNINLKKLLVLLLFIITIPYSLFCWIQLAVENIFKIPKLVDYSFNIHKVFDKIDENIVFFNHSLYLNFNNNVWVLIFIGFTSLTTLFVFAKKWKEYKIVSIAGILSTATFIQLHYLSPYLIIVPLKEQNLEIEVIFSLAFMFILLTVPAIILAFAYYAGLLKNSECNTHIKSAKTYIFSGLFLIFQFLILINFKMEQYNPHKQLFNTNTNSEKRTIIYKNNKDRIKLVQVTENGATISYYDHTIPKKLSVKILKQPSIPLTSSLKEKLDGHIYSISTDLNKFELTMPISKDRAEKDELDFQAFCLDKTKSHFIPVLDSVSDGKYFSILLDIHNYNFECFITFQPKSISTKISNINYQEYDWPSELSQEAGKSLMLENFKLLYPLVLQYEGRPLDDVSINFPNEEKFAKNTIGQWEVDGSKKEDPDIFTINGPTDIRVFPNGQTIQQWPDGLPVRLLKSKDEWKLVSNQKKIYGWVHNRNLKQIPLGKIILDIDSKMAIDFPTSVSNFIKLKADIDYYKILKKEGQCPADLSEAEMDGLTYPEADMDEEEKTTLLALEVARYNAFKNCPKGKSPKKYEQLSKPFPIMKSQKCDCIWADFGFTPEIIDIQRWDVFRKDSCERRDYHYVCTQYAEGDGDVDLKIACPFSCFQ